jgi:hypothetical protein
MAPKASSGFVDECSVIEKKSAVVPIDSKISHCIVVFWVPLGGGVYRGVLLDGNDI